MNVKKNRKATDSMEKKRTRKTSDLMETNKTRKATDPMEKKKTTQKQAIRKVLRYVKRYWIFLLISLILALITVALTLYVPIEIGKAIDEIVYGSVNFPVIRDILLRVAIIVGVTAVAQWFMSILNNKVTYEVVRDIREEAFEKIEVLPLKYLDSHPSGEIVSRMIADVEQFADGLLMGFTQVFTGIMTIIGTLFFMLRLNIGITLFVVLLTPISLFVANFIAKRTYAMFQAQSRTRGEQTTLIDEMLGNEKVVKAYNQEEEVIKRFDEVNERLEKYSLRAIFYSSITNPATRFINAVVYAGVGLTGAFAVIRGTMTVGALSSFLSYSNQYTKPFNEISGVITELQNAIACAARIFELLEEPVEIPDSKNAVILTDVKGNVVCNEVNFSYDKSKKLIENLNLKIHPGQKIAIVGPTGCGKTTIINLLMRFYEVDHGAILVEGEEIRNITRNSLRESYGMVLQDTWLKAGTILENIKMGKEDATREEVISAAKEAHAHSFIKRLPKGYDTVIGEDGGMLSQGQKQLLCISRVMLSVPPILILDEATSSIDTRTEVKIQSAFQKLMQGRTTFIVAHRLSTIQNADVILVMKNGNIIEQGSHEELLAKKGFYKELYESQFAAS
ncbi:ABC transporter related [Lachnoclostridium phytofermentans ISDg]|uniref:ABC transporter related n=2 Tax=Lachnoclostridium phytofermentans TaxID=66219 RepID=A9KLP6_LACP7|nr:ABC transporter ATP-binding protein [Lachnoclostridium phytofermentans]ABX42790.1 ABC transporter related [Lachnoclostridium phytofermentans ISDg]